MHTKGTSISKLEIRAKFGDLCVITSRAALDPVFVYWDSIKFFLCVFFHVDVLLNIY